MNSSDWHTAMQIDREIWYFMESASPLVVAWIALFTANTTWRIIARIRSGIERVPDSPVLTELAGLPLTLLPSICFFWAITTGDLLSAALLLWWGPGFLILLGAVGIAKARKREIDWYPLRNWISWACKLCYLAYVAVFLWFDMYGMLFAFSAWIINDQYDKAFMSLDADRLRRTFDDGWHFRLAYPTGLLIPLFESTLEHRWWYAGYGGLLLILWVAGVAYVNRSGKLREQPEDTTLLRNMAYFRRRNP